MTTEQMEEALNDAGYYLRDDTPIRRGVESFAGYEEAYTLHVIKPFRRKAIYAGNRDWAVEQAYKQVFGEPLGSYEEEAKKFGDGVRQIMVEAASKILREHD